jgi:hypothetical protein
MLEEARGNNNNNNNNKGKVKVHLITGHKGPEVV